jgi:hypothetical protein
MSFVSLSYELTHELRFELTQMPRYARGTEPGMSQAHEAEMSRYEKARNATYEIAPGGDVKSSRSSVSLKTLITKNGQLSESLSSSDC